jgi:hypothetical protein
MNSHAQYISASRRTDLPRFGAAAFFEAWRRGEITYDGGYGRSYTVSLRPEHVLGYIFWSKDFGPFIAHPRFRDLIAASNAIFAFTLNDMPALEPGLAPLEQRLETARRLCDLVGPQRLMWRYDPICRYRTPDGELITTDQPFFALLPRMRKLGVTRCYFSFMALYHKTKSRPVRFEPIPEHTRLALSAAMARSAKEAGMRLFNCCNPDIPANIAGIEQASCVDDSLLRDTDRFGVHSPLKKRPTREGCGCYESRDIGSYSPACAHGCLYCYANPALSPTR